MRVGLAVGLFCVLLTGGVVAGSSLAIPPADDPTTTVDAATTSIEDPFGSLASLESAPPQPAARASLESSVADRCPGGPTEASRQMAADLERGENPAFLEVHPNPTTHGNVGEFFVLVIPEATHLGNWTVTDGHTTASLPNETVSGRIAFSMDPDETRSMTTDPVLELEDYLRLSADGDTLELRDGDRLVDTVSYDRASTAERWYRTGDDGGVRWPKGATCLPSTTVAGDEATAFVLPDSPEVPLETLASAEDRILLAGYTYTSEPVTEELLAAAERGVEVAVLLEAGPVGGTSEEARPVLDALDEAGVTVRVIGDADSRYRFHHPKYAVVDGRSMVLSENWKPSGVGGTASRGWGVVVDDPEVAAVLVEVFESDFEGWDTNSWVRHREKATFVEDDAPGGGFETHFEPEPVSVDAVEVLVAPDNADERTLELLGAAEESIRIKQVRIGGREFPLLEEALEAARRGVDVRILLDATWYVEDENRELAEWLEATAEEEELSLEVRLVEPDGRFEKIHAKGVVIDEEVAIVGSPNWNDVAFTENREVALALHGSEAGSYYAAVFDADWEERSWSLPLGLVGVAVLGLAAAGLVGRTQIGFDARAEESGLRSHETGDGPVADARLDVESLEPVRVEGPRRVADRANGLRDSGSRAEVDRSNDSRAEVDRPNDSRAEVDRSDTARTGPASNCTESSTDKVGTGTGERLRGR